MLARMHAARSTQHAAAAASRPAAPNLCISDYLASLLAIQTRDNGDAMRSHWHTQGGKASMDIIGIQVD